MNSSFPNRWSFSYLKFTKYVTNIIDEPTPVSVNALTTPAPEQNQRKPSRDRTCFFCNGLGHIKARCNWTGQGSPEPHKTCQLCFQKGYIAPTCKKLSKTPSAPELCQLCNISGHTARDCDTLNAKSLGTTPSSQA